MSTHDATPAQFAESAMAEGAHTLATEPTRLVPRREAEEMEDHSQSQSRESGAGKIEDSLRLKRTPSIHPMERLVTTSAVAAAMAEGQGGDLATRRRRISGEVGSLSSAPDMTPEALAAATEQASMQRRSISIPEGLKPGEGSTLESIKRTLDVEENSQLKRNVSVSHLSGIRERLMSRGSAGGSVGPSVYKRTPSASATTTLQRTLSPASPIKRAPSGSGPATTFFSAAKAVAASTTLVTHSGASSTTADNERAEQSQHYQQMMKRFQLRRLNHSGSGRQLSAEAPPVMRRGSARVLPVDTDLGQRRSWDEMAVFARPRSEGERQHEGSDDFSVRSRPTSERDIVEESPRRPGAPSFLPQTSNTSLAATSGAAAATSEVVGPRAAGDEAAPHTGATQNAQADPLLALSNDIQPQTHGLDQTTAQMRPQSASPRRPVTQLAPDGTPGVSPPHVRPVIKRAGPPPNVLSSWRRKARRLLVQLSAPLSPFSGVARFRSSVLLLAFCVHALGFPFEAAFSDGGHAWFLVVDAVTEAMYVVDFLLTFNTSFVNKRGVLVSSRQLIAWNFFTGEFLPQLLAAIPMSTIRIVLRDNTEEALVVGATRERFTHVLLDGILRSHRIVHIMRLFRELGRVQAARADRSMWSWLLFSRYSHLVRIIWIVGAVMLIAHNVACCWYLLLQDDSGGSSGVLCGIISGSRSPNSVAGSYLGEYAACFYESMQMLQGQGLHTQSIGQHVFASFVVLLGSIVLAVIFGHVAMLVANFNANSTAYQRKMESVFAGMSKMQLPASLRERIHQYYAHLWREYEALDGAPLARFAKELAHNLTLEVVLFKYMELAMNVPFWEHCSPDFQKQLVLSLDTRVYMPDDFLIRRGEVGDEFYMINRGICELVGGRDTTEHPTEPLARRLERQGEANQTQADTSTFYMTCYDSSYAPEHFDTSVEGDTFRPTGRREADLRADSTSRGARTPYTWTEVMTRGQAIGELALLMNYQRTANVRAVTYVEMCVLSRDAFQAILTRYPADRKHVIAQILIATLENNERYGVPCPLTAMVRSVFEEEGEELKARGDHQISARRAAKIIASAVNPYLEDDSIKFAVGPKLKEQLTVVRDEEFGVASNSNTADSASNTPRQGTEGTVVFSSVTAPPATSFGTHQRPRKRDDECSCVCRCGKASNADTKNARTAIGAPSVESEAEARMQQLESTQAETLALIQELQRGVQESIKPPSTPAINKSGQEQAGHAPENPAKSDPRTTSTVSIEQSNLEAAATSSAATEQALGEQLRARLTSTGTAPQRRPSFLRVRSSTAPIFTDVEMQRVIASTSVPADVQQLEQQREDAAKKNPPCQDVKKSSAAKYRPMQQRAMTTRLLQTPERSRPLRLPPSAATTTRDARRRAGSGSHRFIQRMANQLTSLTSQSAVTQASPTQYADRLFQSVHEREDPTRDTDHDESIGHDERDRRGSGSTSSVSGALLR